jgi:hypothetical protein
VVSYVYFWIAKEVADEGDGTARSRRAQLEGGVPRCCGGGLTIAVNNLEVGNAFGFRCTHINLDCFSLGEATHVPFGKEPVGEEREEDKFG